MTARRGRPRKFQPESIADAALRAFRNGGYGGTSISDLTTATGTHPGVLYQTFGDKKKLFLAVLQRYSDISLRRTDHLLATGSPLEGVRTYLMDVASLAQSPDGARGCLMANTALELLPGDPDVAAAVRRHFADLRVHVTRAVQRAQLANELSSHRSAAAIADHLVAIAEGILVLGRTTENSRDLLEIVDLSLDMLRSHPNFDRSPS